MLIADISGVTEKQENKIEKEGEKEKVKSNVRMAMREILIEEI
jgi:hypothetical protein